MGGKRTFHGLPTGMLAAVRYSVLSLLLASVGCGGDNDPDQVQELSGGRLVSSIGLTPLRSAVVYRTDHGGAAGDTLYQVWICERRLRDCRRRMTVTGDPAPVLRRTASGLDLIIPEDQTFWDFTNFYHPPDQGSAILIRLIYCSKDADRREASR